jgi:RimJ/RimL family protein N-acetyltransferase
MDIRRLTPADAAAYRALRIRALGEYPEAFTSSYDEEQRRPVEDSAKRLASPHQLFWGAWDGEELAGMVGLERETRAKNRHKATVVGMYVGMEHAGTGLAKRMFAALLEEARREGLELLVLTVTEGNEYATRLYESLGFRSFGIEPKAIKVDGRYYGKNHMVLDLASKP